MSKNRQAGKATKAGLAVLLILAFAVIFGGLFAIQRFRPAGPAASIPQVQGVVETGGPADSVPKSTVALRPLPSAGVTSAVKGCRVNLLTIPWNAAMGLMYANGGRETATKSLMEQNGVHLAIARQDDYGKMQEAQLKFAQELQSNACPTSGAAFTIIMGDGFPAYAAGIGDQITKLNQGVEVIGAIGKSHGEDACMLPYAVANNPQLAKGSLVGAVMRDGDYNICVAWDFQNQIPINPDEKTYDPGAMNFIATDSFSQADEGYIAGKCEDRPVVNNGKRTGETKHICQNGTATWTPGDVNVAKKKGGLAKVASSADYGNQMAAVIIGNRDFDAKNPQIVQGLLKAAFAGGDQVRASDDALLFAGTVSAKIYNEQSGAYWAKYFKGVTESDAQGTQIHLGGSRVMDAADDAYYFGASGGEDVYKSVYELFGNHYVKYYPTVMPSYPPYASVVNLNYLRNIISDTGVTAESSEDKPVFTADQKIERVVSRGNFTIEFDTGQSTIRPEAEPVLKELLGQLISTTLAVEIRGHTDNTGNPQKNVVLSKQRADAVKKYLMTNAPQSFDTNRVKTNGLGDSVPIADNSTVDGRAKNRRVEIILNAVGN